MPVVVVHKKNKRSVCFSLLLLGTAGGEAVKKKKKIHSFQKKTKQVIQMSLLRYGRKKEAQPILLELAKSRKAVVNQKMFDEDIQIKKSMVQIEAARRDWSSWRCHPSTFQVAIPITKKQPASIVPHSSSIDPHPRES